MGRKRKLKTGESAKATKKKNCLSCRHFLKCDHIGKSHKYRCASWKENKHGLARLADEELKSIQSYDLNFKYDPTSETDQTRKFDRALEELLQSEATVATDLRINDSELPKAKNFFEFCTSEQYLGFKPFPKQVQVGIHLFGEACPYCSDPDWYREIPRKAKLSKIARKLCFLEHGKCPSCKRDRTQMIQKGKIQEYFELAGLAGQRSSKSTMISMMSSYVLHYYLKVQNPAGYFSQLANTVFHGTFVGLTYQGGKELLYDPFYNLLADSPWFQEYHAMLRDSEAKLGEELYKFKDTFVHYRHRNLLVYPAGPNKRTLRGKTRFLGAIDEIGWFDISGKDLVKLSASEIYKPMNNSFETIRIESRRLREEGVIDIPKPIFFNISSPSSQLDMINRLYKRSQRRRTRIYGFKYETWRMNPRIEFEDLAEEFENDPIGAWRDFGCEPALSRDPFINDVNDLLPCVRSSKINAASLKPVTQRSKNKRKMLTGKLDWHWSEPKVPKMMALDAGSVSNSFALTVAHNEIDDNNEVTTVYDLMLEIIPNKKTPISFTWLMSDVLVPICEELNVQMVVADRWNSLKLLSDLEEEVGANIEQYSVKYDDFVGVKNGIMEGKIQFPRPTKVKARNIPKINLDKYPDSFVGMPVEHFLLQCLTVEDVVGKTVQKGEVTTDDIFRAMVLNHSMITDPDLYYQFSGNSDIRSRGGIIAVADPNTSVSAVPRIGVIANSGLPR